MSVYAVVVAGGSGKRMGLEQNKVFVPLRGIPAIVRAIAPFSAFCRGVVVVARKDDLPEMELLLTRFHMMKQVIALVAGGEDRQASVYNGLLALPEDADTVLVHDGARALVTEEIIQRVLASIEAHGSGVAAVQVTDTIKRASNSGLVLETLDRSCLYAMQTPQGFRARELRSAHESALHCVQRATDDAALMERMGADIYLCEGSRDNIKLTTPFDLSLADAILERRSKE